LIVLYKVLNSNDADEAGESKFVNSDRLIQNLQLKFGRDFSSMKDIIVSSSWVKILLSALFTSAAYFLSIGSESKFFTKELGTIQAIEEEQRKSEETVIQNSRV
jgi:hypothetical protein